MSNQRRQFLGLAAGAIAVPATAGMVVAQGDPSRGREAPMPAQTSVPERRPAKSGFTGLPALLNPEECVVVLIDHQPFQFANLHSHEPTLIVNNVIGLAKFAKAFKVPVILTTVLEARGGKLIKGVQDVFPDQKPIDRTYINTWQDKRVVDLVKGTGRRKLILAALWTEMCLAMPAIHALGEGYDVYIVTDASGGGSANDASRSRSCHVARSERRMAARLGARVYACRCRQDPDRARWWKWRRIRLGNATSGNFQAVTPRTP